MKHVKTGRKTYISLKRKYYWTCSLTLNSLKTSFMDIPNQWYQTPVILTVNPTKEFCLLIDVHRTPSSTAQVTKGQRRDYDSQHLKTSEWNTWPVWTDIHDFWLNFQTSFTWRLAQNHQKSMLICLCQPLLSSDFLTTRGRAHELNPKHTLWNVYLPLIRCTNVLYLCTTIFFGIQDSI